MAKSFGELGSKKSPKNVLIVDSLNICFRFKHSKKFEFAEELSDLVKSLAHSYKCGRIIITADQGSSSYRKDIFPEYKGNRKEMIDNQTEQEKEDFQKFFQGYEEALEYLEDEFTVLRFPKVEADDIAAYLVKYKKDFGFEKMWLISTDRDWDLLLDNKVSRFSYITRKDYTLEAWGEAYEFHPDDYISFKCLTGDKGDNVPGVPGIGPKRATQLINEYGSVFDIYESLPLQGNQKFIKNLNEFGEQLLTNVELMDLLTYCDEAIGKENIQTIKELVNG